MKYFIRPCPVLKDYFEWMASNNDSLFVELSAEFDPEPGDKVLYALTEKSVRDLNYIFQLGRDAVTNPEGLIVAVLTDTLADRVTDICNHLESKTVKVIHGVTEFVDFIILMEEPSQHE